MTEFSSDDGMDFVSAGEEADILAAKSKALSGETVQSKGILPCPQRDLLQIDVGDAQVLEEGGHAKMERFMHPLTGEETDILEGSLSAKSRAYSGKTVQSKGILPSLQREMLQTDTRDAQVLGEQGQEKIEGFQQPPVKEETDILNDSLSARSKAPLQSNVILPHFQREVDQIDAEEAHVLGELEHAEMEGIQQSLAPTHEQEVIIDLTGEEQLNKAQIASQWKTTRKYGNKTSWSPELIPGKDRDRSPLKPGSNYGMEEDDRSDNEDQEVGWSLRSPLKSPRHKRIVDRSVESGLEMETRGWRDEAENQESLSETFSDEDLISEWESCRDNPPSEQSWDILSDRQYDKKDPRLENWKEELRGSPDLIHQIILMPPYSKTDMVKLWGYIAGHMALEPALATVNFTKIGQEKVFGMLTKTKTHLLEVLKESSSVSEKDARKLRSLALAVTGKIICMRPMKKTKSRYPKWLQEEEMVRMLQGVQRHWERRVAENKTSEPMLSPFLKDMGDPRTIMTAAEFVDWLVMVVSHLKLRRKDLWEQTRMEKRTLEQMRPGTLTPVRKGNMRTPERRRMQDRTRQWAVEDSTDGDGEGSRKAGRGGQGTSPAGGMSPQTGELGGKGRREHRSPGLARSSEPTPTQIFEAETEGRGKEEESKAKKALFKEGKGSQEGRNTDGEEPAILTSVKASWGSEMEDAEKADKEREEGVEKKRRRREEQKIEIGQMGSQQPDTRPLLDFPPVKETAVTGTEKETLVPSEVRAIVKTDKRTGTESGGPGGGSKDNEEAERGSEGPPAQSGVVKEKTKTSGGQKGPQGVDGDGGGSEGQFGNRGALREGGQEQVVRPRVPRGQPPAPLAGGISYARAVDRRTGTGSGSAQAPIRGLARSELDILKDEEFLQRFYESIPEEQDPRQRYVVRFQYKGEDPNKVSRQYVGREIVINQLKVPREHITALIIPLGSKEIDICLASETTYQRFWDVLRIQKQLNPSFLEEYNIVPLFRGDTRVVTISFRTTVIPPEDVAKWLKRRCRVLMEPEKKVDENGFWTGEYRVIVALYRDPVSGRLRHLPKYFFLGADRGITSYGGQPPACFRCGGFDHMRKFCPASLCSKCGTRGHNTVDCKEEVSCSLCAKRGHVYRFCPESELNIRYPEAFQREWERANRAREEEEEARQFRETRQKDPAQGADGPMDGPKGGRENMSKRKRREEVRAWSQEEGKGNREVEVMCSTSNRFGVLQVEEEETTEMEVAAEETGQGKSQRRDGKRGRKQREPTGQIPVRREKTMDELYVQQRKMRARRAAVVSEREWWEDRQKAKPTVDGEKSIQELREEEKEIGIDMEILDMQIEDAVMREWEKAEVEERKGETEGRRGIEIEEEMLSPPVPIGEEVEAEAGQEKGNWMGKENHGLVRVPPDPPKAQLQLTDQLQTGVVGKPK